VTAATALVTVVATAIAVAAMAAATEAVAAPVVVAVVAVATVAVAATSSLPAAVPVAPARVAPAAAGPGEQTRLAVVNQTARRHPRPRLGVASAASAATTTKLASTYLKGRIFPRRPAFFRLATPRHPLTRCGIGES